MPKKIQAVIQEPSGTFDGAVKSRHPAFGKIAASRVTGNANLFGTDFTHQHFISLRIYTAYKERHLSRDWTYTDKILAEINLSEAQWVGLVSHMNAASGTECTLDYFAGEDIPGLPDPEDPARIFCEDMKGLTEEARKHVSKALEAVNAAPLSATKKREIAGLIEQAARSIGSSAKFIADSFEEHTEETVEKAKAEVHAYAENAIRNLGLNALANGALPVTMAALEKKENTDASF